MNQNLQLVHNVIGRKVPYPMPGKPQDCLEEEMSLQFVNGDICIVTFPKTGTTLMQYICHLLRTNGSEDFVDIHQVSPQISSAWFIGQKLNDPTAMHQIVPRMFKSHRNLDQVAAFSEGVKYIATIRNPLSTLYSMHAFRSKRGSNVSSLLEFAKSDMWTTCKIEGCIGNIFDCFVTLWKCRFCSNILIVPYEDLVESPSECIPLIAAFMNVACDNSLVDLVVQKTSREAMLGNVHKFDESWCAQRMKELGRTNRSIGSQVASKVNSSEVYANREGSGEVDEQVALLQRELWSQKVSPITGLLDYEAMRAEMKRILLTH